MMITFGYFGGAPLPASFGLLMFIAVSGGFLFFVPFTYTAAKMLVCWLHNSNLFSFCIRYRVYGPVYPGKIHNNNRCCKHIIIFFFGEYFPFEKLLAPVKEFFFGPGDMFSPGEKAAVLASSDNGIYAKNCNPNIAR